MGWLSFLGLLLSNSPDVLISLPIKKDREATYLSGRRQSRGSLHFFVQPGDDYLMVLSGVATLMIMAELGQQVSLMVKAGILFSASLIAYVTTNLMQNEVRLDVVLSLVVMLYLIVDQTTDRGSASLVRYPLACPLITFMFTLTGLRRSGLLMIFLASETVRLTVAAAQNDWHDVVSVVATDALCLGYGICLYLCIFYVGLEILRVRDRPRLAIQDVPYIQHLELAAFRNLPVEMNKLSHGDHINVLLRLVPTIQTSTSIVPAHPAAGKLVRKNVLTSVAEGSDGSPEQVLSPSLDDYRPAPDRRGADRRLSSADAAALGGTKANQQQNFRRRDVRHKTVTFGSGNQPEITSTVDAQPSSPTRSASETPISAVTPPSQDTQDTDKPRRSRRPRMRTTLGGAIMSTLSTTSEAARSLEDFGLVTLRHSPTTSDGEPPATSELCCGIQRGPNYKVISAGAVPLLVSQKKNALQRFLPFLLDLGTEAVIQQARWTHRPPSIRTGIFGRYTDTKIERWYLAWKCASFGRWFEAAIKCLICQQVLTLITLFKTMTFVEDKKEDPMVSARVFWILWVLRLFGHIGFGVGFFYLRVRGRLLPRYPLLASRIYGAILVIGAYWDFVVLATYSPLSYSFLFNVRSVSYLFQLSVFPFYFQWSRPINALFLIFCLSLHTVLHMTLRSSVALTLNQIFPLAAGCLFQHFFIVRPLELNSRALFATYCLPYLLYLDSLKSQSYSSTSETFGSSFEEKPPP